MSPEDIGSLECAVAGGALIRAVRGVGGDVALEVLPPLVQLGTNAALVRNRFQGSWGVIHDSDVLLTCIQAGVINHRVR
jgi:hypothetical protein